MANNYEQATVTPSIPKRLVSELEKALLSGFGFGWEQDGDAWYFFVEDSIRGDECLLQLRPAVLQSDQSPIAHAIRRYLEEEQIEVDWDTESEIDIEIPARVASWEGAFQQILSKPTNRGKVAVDEVVVMAAYYCSKLRAGEFGGWVARITRNDVQYDGTYRALDRMRAGATAEDLSEMVQAGVAAARRVVGAWESGDLAGAVNELEGWAEGAAKTIRKSPSDAATEEVEADDQSPAP